MCAPYTPHPSTAAQLSRAHQRPKIRSGLTLSPKRSHALSPSLPQEQIDARDEREVKLQAARRHRTGRSYALFHRARSSRGQRGAPDASVDARSMRTSRAPVCRQASARPARGSLGGSAAAFSAASAAPPSMTPGKAAPLAGGGVGRLQRARMRLRPTGVCRR